jgi:peptidoglycan hydrolase CwlO-like protein
MRSKLIVLVVLLLAAAPAGAQTSSQDLEQAREDRTWAEAEVRAISHDFEALAARYAKVREEADLSAARLVDALLTHSQLQADAAAARALLDGRADAIYRAGPAAFVDVLLGSSSPGDMLARQELIERALGQGVEDSVLALEARHNAGDLIGEMEEARAELVRHQIHLSEIRYRMEVRLVEARSELESAEDRIAEIERQRRELMDAAALEDHYLALIEVDGELGELLEMLGPTGGRGCTIPPALETTGQVFEGESSFYGEEFAGNPTAIGHIFNPALFTAAHRTLPLPSFLHVRYGSRCATVLVNDRGPYVDGRILDLSEGAATYLGLPGVGDVRCEILKPA